MTRANDLCVHLRGAGEGYVGLGRGRDHGCARGAAEAALTSPLLEVGIESARRVLLTVATKHSVEIVETRTVMQVVADAAHADARIIYCTSVNPDLTDDMEITIIAAAFGRPTGRVDV